MYLSSSGSAGGVGQCLKEEQERRAEAEEQVQLLKQKLYSEFATLTIVRYFGSALPSFHLNSTSEIYYLE